MRPRANSIECGGVLTVVEVRNRLQDMAIGVKSFWSADSTREVSVRVQDDLGIDEVPRGDSLVQSLAKRNGGGHVCKLSEWAPFVAYRIRSATPEHVAEIREILTWTKVISRLSLQYHTRLGS